MKRSAFLLVAVGAIGCGGGGTLGTCDANAVDGVAVTATDPLGGAPYALGYPPYAVDGCTLAYVSPSGELRLRDLAGGDETVLAPAGEKPRRPTIAGDLVAWEATASGKSAVRVRGKDGTTTIAGAFDHAGEPRAAADAVVFTGWRAADDKGDTDVFLYTPSTGMVVAVTTGPAQQRFPDVSATHIAWSDFAEDPDGAFGDDSTDAADVVVLDRSTMERTTRALPGKQAFPLLGAEGKVAYLDWGLVHPEPKFSGYTLRIGPIAGDGAEDADVAPISTLQPYVRPVARASRLSWVSTQDGGTALLQRGVDLAEPAEIVNVFNDASVFGPSASESMTLVGAFTDGSVTLRAFTH